MDPTLAAGLVAPSLETFCDCIPTDSRSSWDSRLLNKHPRSARKVTVPAKTASTRIESSSAVHLELVAIFLERNELEGWEGLRKKCDGCAAVLCEPP